MNEQMNEHIYICVKLFPEIHTYINKNKLFFWGRRPQKNKLLLFIYVCISRNHFSKFWRPCKAGKKNGASSSEHAMRASRANPEPKAEKNRKKYKKPAAPRAEKKRKKNKKPAAP